MNSSQSQLKTRDLRFRDAKRLSQGHTGTRTSSKTRADHHLFPRGNGSKSQDQDLPLPSRAVPVSLAEALPPGAAGWFGSSSSSGRSPPAKRTELVPNCRLPVLPRGLFLLGLHDRRSEGVVTGRNTFLPPHLNPLLTMHIILHVITPVSKYAKFQSK